MTFGKTLREIRKRSKQSQIETVAGLSAMFPDMRISQTSYSVLELRDTAPRESVLRCLCEYFGVSISIFFEAPERDTEKARQWLQSLSSRVYAPGIDREGVLTTADNLYLWQPDFPDDEYLED